MLLEYPSDDGSGVGPGGGAQCRESLVDRLAHHVRQRDASPAKGLHLAKSIGIQPDIHQSGTHAVKICCLYDDVKGHVATPG